MNDTIMFILLSVYSIMDFYISNVFLKASSEKIWEGTLAQAMMRGNRIIDYK